MIRVLEICGGLRQGGAETMLVNLFKVSDRAVCQIDFLVYDKEDTYYSKEINAKGGRIIHMERGNSAIQYCKNLYHVLSEYGPYDVVHAHTNYHSGFAMVVAHAKRVPIRICHSHSAKRIAVKSPVRFVYSCIMRRIILQNANVLMACGVCAGCSLFGRNAFRKRGVILYNPIQIDLYKDISLEEKRQMRASLDICNSSLVVGSIASFREAKNHAFMIDIAKSLKKKGIKFSMVFVGDGVLKKSIEDRVNTEGLEHEVVFTGVRSDVPRIIQMFDILLMPSLYEGFPVTLIESQAAGVPALISDCISNEVDCKLGLVSSLSLNANASVWAEKLIAFSRHERPDWELRCETLYERGFDTSTAWKKLYSIYSKQESK